jgi:signal transduction histidine kinase
MLPIGLSSIYFFVVGNEDLPGEHSTLPLLYYGLFLFTLVLAIAGAYYFSNKISRPITHFIQTATEIARGNFAQEVVVESNDEIGRLARIFNYMTDQLRRIHEKNLHKIINEKSKTETILKNIADGVIVTDSANRILLVNTVAARWFSLLSVDYVEHPLEDLIGNRKLTKFIKDITANVIKKLQSIEIVVENPDHPRQQVLQARAARIMDDESGALVAIVTILRDITREKEIDRMKTELVSMVAHELRSPLTCISGFSELLLDMDITREQSEEYAHIILKESNRLSDLINKFLDISKIESGKSQMQKTPVDLRMLIEKVLDFNSQLAEKKQIQVDFDAPQEVSTMNLDRDMMEQVILNLYSNAIKYCPERASVSIRLIENEKDITIDIEDSGFGISEKSLPHIFEKFYRVTDNEKVMDITGSGLGLALVREIVEIHGGKIKVRSALGKGSTFTIVLPRSASTVPALAPQPALV